MTTLPPQYEDPDAAVSIALFKARMPAANLPGSLMSGARILNFANGWAKPVLVVDGVRAHWFRRTGETALSLCDLKSPVEIIHGAGNWPRCANCIRVMRRLIRAGQL